jgi:hypothetical protein
MRDIMTSINISMNSQYSCGIGNLGKQYESHLAIKLREIRGKKFTF